MKLLIVEDDVKITNFLNKGLKEEGYTVDISHNGQDALYLVQEFIYDLILLDIMIPEIDGITLCKKIRASFIKTPIIMLTAKSTIENKVLGLNEGANDYLTKPFSFDELLARIRVQLRNSKTSNNVVQVEDLRLDRNTKQVKRGNTEILLTQKEFAILEFLMTNSNQIISPERLNQTLWNMEEETFSNIINVYMYRLRNKIDKNQNIKLMHTFRGQGFKLGKT